MIFDSIANANAYLGICETLDIALNYIQKQDFASLRPGSYPIAREDVFMSVVEKEAIKMKPCEGNNHYRLEAHREYADIHVLIAGSEQIWVGDVSGMRLVSDFDENDCGFYAGEVAAKCILSPGSFVVCMPQDAHMGAITEKEAAVLKKALLKVRIKDIC